MQTAHTDDSSCAAADAGSRDAKHLFGLRFKASLRACLRKRFTLEESFGLVFAETLLEVRLTEKEEAELYGALIDWATKSSELFSGYSTGLFTDSPRRFSQTPTRQRG